MKKFTLLEFIQKAIIVHGDKYDYSKVDYKDIHTKVTIICPIHGEFLQTPNNHLRGQDCPICFGNILSTTEQFTQKARKVHGDKYDYSRVIYINSWTKVIIICPIHGEFLQTPNKHLLNRGCPGCKFDKITKINSSDVEYVIKKFINVHGDFYDYSKVIYLGNHKKIIIICPKHGEFLQTPSSHIQGTNCPTCNSSKGELALEEIFKKYNIKYESQYNIPEIVNNYKIDFYLPAYRLLVEFHGIQHYEYIPFFHDNDIGWDFETQKRRDDMVRDASIRWKYNYLEFNYKQLKHMTSEQFEVLVINKISQY